MKHLKVIIGCERSGIIREAFRALGHDCYSCDLTPAEDGSPFHLQMDVREALKRGPWDLFIVHPECRYLANSGVLRLYTGGKKANGRDEQRWAFMIEAALFFKEMLEADVPSVCVENPVMHGHALAIIGQRHTQTFQPWEFGDDASKRTCLWLKGLARLRPTRPIDRARTYPGPAKAMAEQWGGR